MIGLIAHFLSGFQRPLDSSHQRHAAPQNPAWPGGWPATGIVDQHPGAALQSVVGQSRTFRQQFKNRDGFFTVWRTEVQHNDLFALQFFKPPHAAADKLDDPGSFAVWGQQQRKDIGENPAVGGIGSAVIYGDKRRFVARHIVNHGIGDPNRKRVPCRNVDMMPFAWKMQNAGLAVNAC